VARRHGERWFLGAMTNEQARHVPIATDFLGDGRWRATIFADGTPASQARMTKVEISSRDLRAGDALELALAPCGGQAILFEPV
jgi:alpha-glucosidase